MDDLLARIIIDPKIMVGKPTIRGLRITVEQIRLALAAGISKEDLLREYPPLEEDDFRAVLAYSERLPD